MNLQSTTLIEMIKIIIYINNYYYERKFKKTGEKLLFFRYKKIIFKTPYYKLMLMELGSIRKVRHDNIREKLKY